MRNIVIVFYSRYASYHLKFAKVLVLGSGSTRTNTAKPIGVTQTQPQKTFRPHAIYTGLCQAPRDGSVYIQPLEKLQYICRTCTWRCNFLHKSSNFLHKSSEEEEWLSWLQFCLFSAVGAHPWVGAEGTAQSFSPVSMC